MNKVVSINLNGLIFTIDEHAYEKLKDYIEGLRKYFAGTEGAAEIISDIETRIAELLQQRLSDKYTVIQLEDVNEVIAMMGDPREIDGGEHAETKQEQAHQTQQQKPIADRKLRRDTGHKVLGGVCSGAANYFGIDVIIIRVLFLIAFFVYGTGLLLYFVLWIVVPAATARELETNNTKAKRLFRNPDDRRVGGVCSGIAMYLGIDKVWLRLAFLVAFFVFGTGLLVYIILWIAMPLARTASDRLQMSGEPIDINNIERVVKNSAANQADQRRNGFAEALGTLMLVAGKVLGAVFLILALIFIVWVVMFAVGITDYQSRIVQQVASSHGIYAKVGMILFALGSGGLFILLAIKLLFNFRFKAALPAVILSVVTVIGIGVSGYGIGGFFNSISNKETIKEPLFTSKKIDTLYIRTNEIAFKEDEAGSSSNRTRVSLNENFIGFTFMDDDGDKIFFQHSNLNIKPSQNDSMYVVLYKMARGYNKAEAASYASAINYGVKLEGNTLWLDEGVKLSDEGPFKNQHVTVALKLPVGTVLKVDRKAMEMINRINHSQDFNLGETILVTEKGIRCIDCEDDDEHEDLMIDEGDEDDEHVSINVDDDNFSINIGKNKGDKVSTTYHTDTINTPSGKQVRKEKVQKAGAVTIRKSETKPVE